MAHTIAIYLLAVYVQARISMDAELSSRWGQKSGNIKHIKMSLLKPQFNPPFFSNLCSNCFVQGTPAGGITSK